MNFASLIRKRPWNLSWLRRLFRPRRGLGDRGEREAGRYLRRQGFRVLERNFRCPLGEIDLVCGDGPTVVFVEVKTRSGFSAQEETETVRFSQWSRIDRAARYFLRQRSAEHRPYRFDLVTVEFPDDSSPRVEHFEDAYCPRRRS